MIHYLLVQNRQGKTRVSKWYEPYEDAEKRQLAGEVHRLVNERHSGMTNFIEFRQLKVVYRRYAGLYFCAVCDVDDNELSVLEGIHLLVETLDIYFGNVCELDLVFNFYIVYTVLDEIILNGEIMETSKKVILSRIDSIDKHTKASS